MAIKHSVQCAIVFQMSHRMPAMAPSNTALMGQRKSVAMTMTDRLMRSPKGECLEDEGYEEQKDEDDARRPEVLGDRDGHEEVFLPEQVAE